MPTPSSSTAIGGSYASCARGSARIPRRPKIVGLPALEEAFQWPLARAGQIRSQQQRQRGWKLYSFHAPEVECIGKGKASAPYEFGVKTSIVTTNARAPGGQFVLYAKALPGNPYENGHSLRAAIEDTERLTGREIERAYATKDTAATMRRTHIASSSRAEARRVRRRERELRRRSAIEPVIGHMKPKAILVAAISKEDGPRVG